MREFEFIILCQNACKYARFICKSIRGVKMFGPPRLLRKDSAGFRANLCWMLVGADSKRIYVKQQPYIFIPSSGISHLPRSPYGII